MLVNLFSIAFLTVSIVFSFFPPGLPVTLLTMNWSCVVFGAAVLVGLFYFAIWGRKEYHGPIVDIEDTDLPARGRER